MSKLLFGVLLLFISRQPDFFANTEIDYLVQELYQLFGVVLLAAGADTIFYNKKKK